MNTPSVCQGHARASGLAAMMLAAAVASAAAQTVPSAALCAQPLPDPITRVDAGGTANPVLSRDGCWLFVMAGPQVEGGPGVVVLRRDGATFTKVQIVPAPFIPAASGMVLTNDQQLLIVSVANALTFIDVEKATTGAADAVLGQTPIGGAFRIAISPDDTMLFVAQFAAGRVAVFDLDRARRSGFSAESLTPVSVPTGQNPITVAVAPDGRHLYATNLVAPDVLAGPLACIDGKQREGGLQVIDVRRVKADASTATVGWAFPAGCGPNAMTLSPDGSRLSNTAANDIFDPGATGNVLVVFDTTPRSRRQGADADGIGACAKGADRPRRFGEPHHRRLSGRGRHTGRPARGGPGEARFRRRRRGRDHPVSCGQPGPWRGWPHLDRNRLRRRRGRAHRPRTCGDAASRAVM
jgi:hypothetical protein